MKRVLLILIIGWVFLTSKAMELNIITNPTLAYRQEYINRLSFKLKYMYGNAILYAQLHPKDSKSQVIQRYINTIINCTVADLKYSYWDCIDDSRLINKLKDSIRKVKANAQQCYYICHGTYLAGQCCLSMTKTNPVDEKLNLIQEEIILEKGWEHYPPLNLDNDMYSCQIL